MTTPLLAIENLFAVQNLSIHFERHAQPPIAVVSGVDLHLQRGETLALLGESGCGKSLTALALMRLLPPAARISGGRVQLEATNLLALPEAQMRQVRGGRLAMIFQEPQTSLNPVLTIGAQIAEAVRLHAKPADRQPARVTRRVLQLLDSVGISAPARRMRDYPHQLSGGMKQRVMIAMALAGDPQVLIADEPTTALDVTIQAQVLQLIKDLQRDTGLAVLLITHDLGVVAETADRLAVMYAGQLVEVADCAQFFAAPAHPYSRKLLASVPTAAQRHGKLAAIPGRVPPLDQVSGGCRFAERCFAVQPRCQSTVPNWQQVQNAQQVRCHLWQNGAVDWTRWDTAPPASVVTTPPVAEITPPAHLLEVIDLKVHFPIQRGLFKRTVGAVRAVDGVNLTLAAGETLALVGESGCGKTTVGKAILQLERPTGGQVRYAGVELTQLRGEALRQQRRALQIVFQDPFAAMNPRLLVEDIVGEGLQALGIEPQRARRRQRVTELLDLVGIDATALQRYPHEFSGGQRQRICIARALAVMPQVLICDEPTSALDVSVQAQILNLLKELQQQLGISYLFITHNLAVVSYLAQRVAVMYLGRIVELGMAAEVLTAPRHPYTQALLSAVPVIDPSARRQPVRLSGDLPSPITPPSGCHFHPRCPLARPQCAQMEPPVVAVSATQQVRCFAVQWSNHCVKPANDAK
ncbi:ABC transporter ATP-binding protein [Rhodoferax sp. 4810]|uniref:ABC-type dipeptide transporter n=1 Tax=Thiospirillum jenense TaxID=1653858 RepID=A0A839HEM2_9GAMM|nr:ABC transporter ATP-binding protein [Thiospirillum jenense]MBB1074687.1 ABC transporter ATP-binding protein [Rhodoferax jenense]MBB1125469.1 ABC transporter ATP-binding protein [Thiospirillum jenense]